MQNGQKEEGLFIELRKGEGVMGKMPCPLPPPRWEIGEGAGARRRRQIRQLGGSGWLRGEGNERGEGGGSIPGRGSARGGPRWPSHDGRQQRVAVALGRRLRGVVAAMEVGKSTGELRGVDYSAHLGQG